MSVHHLPDIHCMRVYMYDCTHPVCASFTRHTLYVSVHVCLYTPCLCIISQTYIARKCTCMSVHTLFVHHVPDIHCMRMYMYILSVHTLFVHHVPDIHCMRMYMYILSVHTLFVHHVPGIHCMRVYMYILYI